MATIEELANAMANEQRVYSPEMDRWYSIKGVYQRHIEIAGGGCIRIETLKTFAQVEEIEKGELFTLAEVEQIVEQILVNFRPYYGIHKQVVEEVSKRLAERAAKGKGA